MPCCELFEAQDDAYRESVLPKAIRKRVTVEAASPLGWHRFAGDEGAILAINRFGASAPGEDIFRHLGFTPEHVTAAALRVLGRIEDADRASGSEA
jgi:transketolase